MATIIEYPKGAEIGEDLFLFPDGSSIQLNAGDSGFLTVAQAVYMLDEAKFRIHSAMKGNP